MFLLPCGALLLSGRQSVSYYIPYDAQLAASTRLTTGCGFPIYIASRIESYSSLFDKLIIAQNKLCALLNVILA